MKKGSLWTLSVDEYIESYCRKYHSVERAISHYRGSCGVRYRRLRAEWKRKFVHRPRSYDAIRVSPIAESARKRGTTLAERFSWLSRVKEPRMLQNLVEET